MARSIGEIKNEIEQAFMSNNTLADAYSFEVGKAFENVFSKVSLESIIFYVVASCIWTLETLFDKHKSELQDLIDSKKPHRLKWYRDKALSFQYGRSLQEDSDTYAEVVDSEKIVKYASAVEYQGKLYIKVAKGSSSKEPLSAAEHTALQAYYADIKDAGVVIDVVNMPADHFAISLAVYYDPMVFSSEGMRLDNGEDSVRNCIRDYIQNKIPFNGEYRNSALVDSLQALDGVVIPELRSASTITAADFASASPVWTDIQAKHIPASGYYKIYSDNDLNVEFIAYQTIESV